MNYIGIDLGVTSGAIAFIDGGVASVKDLPTSVVAVGRRERKTYDFDGFLTIVQEAQLRSWQLGVTVVVEDIYHIGYKGSLAARAAGVGWGMVRTACAAYRIPVIAASPNEWKRAMLSGRAKGKGASRARAEELFPGIDLGKKSDEGRAEAMLLAEYGRRICQAGGIEAQSAGQYSTTDE